MHLLLRIWHVIQSWAKQSCPTKSITDDHNDIQQNYPARIWKTDTAIELRCQLKYIFEPGSKNLDTFNLVPKWAKLR